MTLLFDAACSIILRVPGATPMDESFRGRQTTLILFTVRDNMKGAIAIAGAIQYEEGGASG